MTLGQVLRHAAGGAIGHDRAAAVLEHVVDANRQGVFLAQVAAGGVDHRQAVGIRVLAKTDVGPGLRTTADGTPERFSAVGSGRWANWPSGVAPSSSRPATQGLQESLAQQAAGPVVGVQQDRKAAAADTLDVDRGHHRLQVSGKWVAAFLVARASRRCGALVNPFRSIPLEHLLSRPGGNDPTLRRKQFQPVILRTDYGWR